MNVVEHLRSGDVHDREFYAALEQADRDDLTAILALAGDEDPAVRVSVASTLPMVHSHHLQPAGVVETHGEPDGEAFGWWALMEQMLDLAPYRAAEFLEDAGAFVVGDARALEELLTNSALSPEATQID